MSSLLEQAVIDAKALKEAAIKNAQNRVLEQYSEHIKEAVDSILDDEEEVMDREDELAPDVVGGEEEMGMGDDVDTLGLGGEEEPAPVEPGMEDQMPSALEAGEEEVEIDLDQLSDIVNAELEGTEQGIADEAGDMGDAVAALKDTVEDLKDAVEDIKATEGGEETDNTGDVVEPPMHYPADQPIQEQEEEDDVDEEEFISALGEFAKEATVEKETPEATVKADIGVDEPEPHQWTKNVAREKEEKARRQALAALKEQNTKLNTKNSKLVSQLTKYKEATKKMVAKIEEVNLQNARLLYKNQALSSDSLNERQKDKIVEAISKANSVKEAKLIFETLQNAIVDDKAPGAGIPKSLHEVRSKKVSFVQKGTETSEEDVTKSRWQKLAGLI